MHCSTSPADWNFSRTLKLQPRGKRHHSKPQTSSKCKDCSRQQTGHLPAQHCMLLPAPAHFSAPIHNTDQTHMLQQSANWLLLLTRPMHQTCLWWQHPSAHQCGCACGGLQTHKLISMPTHSLLKHAQHTKVHNSRVHTSCTAPPMLPPQPISCTDCSIHAQYVC